VKSPLSAREGEICLAASRGLTNKAIADLLVLRQCTVDSYWRRIFLKTEATGRTQAVALWIGAQALTPANVPHAKGAKDAKEDKLRTPANDWTAYFAELRRRTRRPEYPKGFCGKLKVELVRGQVVFGAGPGPTD